jgi:hypothetical protein
VLLVAFEILLLNGNCLHAQTQEKLEEEWAIACFRKQHKNEAYPKFSGQISVIDTNTYKFDEKTLIIYDACNELRYLLEQGIFYPNIITGNVVAEIKTDQELEQMPVNKRIIYNVTRIDCFIISGFEEIRSISKSPKHKRFKFYLSTPNTMNPKICFLELTNESALRTWPFEDFIKECRVTHFEVGSVLI